MDSVLAVRGLQTSSQAVYMGAHEGLRGLDPSSLEILSIRHNVLGLGICMAELEVTRASQPREHALHEFRTARLSI